MVTIKVKLMEMFELCDKALDKMSTYRGHAAVYMNTESKNYMETVQELYHMEYVDNDDTVLYVDILLYEDIVKIAHVTFD